MVRLVLAGNYRQFEDWCREQRISLRQLHVHRVVYVAGTHHLNGLGPVEVVRVGTWYDRPLDLLRAVQDVEARSATLSRDVTTTDR